MTAVKLYVLFEATEEFMYIALFWRQQTQKAAWLSFDLYLQVNPAAAFFLIYLFF